MGLIKKNLTTILDGFAKPIADLDTYIDEQKARKDRAVANIQKLDKLASVQRKIMQDADFEGVAAHDAKAQLIKAFPFLSNLPAKNGK